MNPFEMEMHVHSYSGSFQNVETGGSWKDLVGTKVRRIGGRPLVTLGDCTPEERPSKRSGRTDSLEQP